MKIVAFVLAGGEGRRLRPLTAEEAKPAVPFANGCRLVDFVLANLVNSGVQRIHVLAQYKPASLVDHIDRRWRPGAQARGADISVLLPDERGPYRGTADAVARHRHLIAGDDADLVAVFAADHVYRMDVRQMAAYHRQRCAEVTVAAVPVPLERCSDFGIVGADGHGRVHDFHEKPRHPVPMAGQPGSAYASMGNYLFEPGVLDDLLRIGAARDETDFGHHVLPRAARSHATYAYDFAGNRVPGTAPWEEPGYWRDVGTLAALRQAQRDVRGAAPRFRLFNPEWPIVPADGGSAPATAHPGRVRAPREWAAGTIPGAWRAPRATGRLAPGGETRPSRVPVPVGRIRGVRYER